MEILIYHHTLLSTSVKTKPWKITLPASRNELGGEFTWLIGVTELDDRAFPQRLYTPHRWCKNRDIAPSHECTNLPHIVEFSQQKHVTLLVRTAMCRSVIYMIVQHELDFCAFDFLKDKPLHVIGMVVARRVNRL